MRVILTMFGKLWLPVAFSKKYFAYEVTVNGWSHCHPGSERDWVLMWLCLVDGNTYISLPYDMPNWSHTTNN